MATKREIALAGVEVTDLAMELAGGSACRKGSRIERAYRDVRAAKLHPFTPEATLLHGGRLTLGSPATRCRAHSPGRAAASPRGMGTFASIGPPARPFTVGAMIARADHSAALP